MELKANDTPNVVGLKRRAETNVPLLDDPPLGHLQALVLKKLDTLGSEAFGYNVLEELSLETGVWIDHAQIYSTIRKLIDKKFIELEETRAQKKGPPLKIYRVRAAGHAALEATADHHQAVAEYIKK